MNRKTINHFNRFYILLALLLSACSNNPTGPVELSNAERFVISGALNKTFVEPDHEVTGQVVLKSEEGGKTINFYLQSAYTSSKKNEQASLEISAPFNSNILESNYNSFTIDNIVSSL